MAQCILCDKPALKHSIYCRSHSRYMRMLKSPYKSDRNKAIYDAIENGESVKDVAKRFSISYKRAKDIHDEHAQRISFLNRV